MVYALVLFFYLSISFAFKLQFSSCFVLEVGLSFYAEVGEKKNLLLVVKVCPGHEVTKESAMLNYRLSVTDSELYYTNTLLHSVSVVSSNNRNSHYCARKTFLVLPLYLSRKQHPFRFVGDLLIHQHPLWLSSSSFFVQRLSV